jgi:cell division protein FtsQ
MPFSGMRRRYRRLKLRWGPILWVLLILNIAAGLCFSPLTAIRWVRVDGAPSWEEPRLTAIVLKLEGVPCAQVKRTEIESAVLSLPEVRSARLDRNLFGSADLRVGYRQAVARIDGSSGIGLSLEGVMFPSDHLSPDLPTVRLDPEQMHPGLGIAANWPIVAVARLAVKAREIADRKPLVIELGKGSVLCLNMGAGQVNFGSCDDMDAKLTVLKRLLSQDPNYLSRVKTLDLALASAPTAVPKTSGDQN